MCGGCPCLVDLVRFTARTQTIRADFIASKAAACMRCFFHVLSRLSWNTKSAIQELSIHASSFLPFLASGQPQKVEARIPSSAPPQPTFFIEIDNVSLFSHGLFELSTLVSSPSPTSRCILSGCSLLATTSAL